MYPPGSVTRAASFVLVFSASAFAPGVLVTTSPAPSSIAAAAARSASSLFLRCAHACPPATRLVPLVGTGSTSSLTTPLARCQWGKSSASGTGAARSFSATRDAALNAFASSSSSSPAGADDGAEGADGAESRRAMELRGTSPGATAAAVTTGAAIGSPPRLVGVVPIMAAIALVVTLVVTLAPPASPPISAAGTGAFARVSSRTPSSSSSSSSSSFFSFSFFSSVLFFLSSSALAHSSPAVGGMAGGSPAAKARDMMSTSSPECLATSGESPLVTASNARGFVGASLASLSISALGITYPIDSSSALHRSSRQPCSAAYTASLGRSRSPASLFLR